MINKDLEKIKKEFRYEANNLFEMFVSNTKNHPNCIYKLTENELDEVIKDLGEFTVNAIKSREEEIKKIIQRYKKQRITSLKGPNPLKEILRKKAILTKTEVVNNILSKLSNDK
jgi:UDP-N-acetylmuramyl tripeptide synthase